MLDRLPSELVALVIEHAVAIFRDADRTSVVHLAMTSSVIYDLVAPLLYRKVVIKRSTITKLSRHSLDPRTRLAAERVFHHTRELYLLDPRSGHLDFSLLRNMEAFNGITDMVLDIARDLRKDESDGSRSSSQPRRFSLRRLLVISEYTTTLDIPHEVRENITHICAIMPDEGFHRCYALLVAKPVEWTMAIIDAYPHLTHLAFHLWSHAKHQNPIVHFDIEPMAQVIRTALAYPRLKVVAVRVTVDFLTRWKEDILVALQAIHGSGDRLRVWLDGREGDWNQILLEDARLGQSIWTEARPVATLNAAA